MRVSVETIYHGLICINESKYKARMFTVLSPTPVAADSERSERYTVKVGSKFFYDPVNDKWYFVESMDVDHQCWFAKST